MTIANRVTAGAIILLGAVLFSTKAILVKLALPYGIDPVSLLLLRMICALPIYLIIVAWIELRGQATSPSSVSVSPSRWIPQVIGLGMAGYYLASYFDFVGLKYIPASLERVILYLYPTLVLLISAVFLKRKISIHQAIAIGLCYVGVWIAVRFGTNEGTANDWWTGVGLIFLSALTYAIYLVGSGELIPQLGVLRFTCYAMIVSTFCICIHFLSTVEILTLFDYPSIVYQYAVAMAIFATVIPSFLISAGIQRIGASNAAIIGGIGPISTIVLASIFLDESFTLSQMLGTAMVIMGVVYISVNMKVSK